VSARESSPGRIASFEQFWPFYLGEHRLPATRWMHFVGSSLSLVNLTFAVITPWYLLSALLAGYGFAWVSHFFIEKNKPASFKYPLWSFVADWKMWAFIVTGRIDAELGRLHIGAAPTGSEGPVHR